MLNESGPVEIGIMDAESGDAPILVNHVRPSLPENTPTPEIAAIHVDLEKQSVAHSEIYRVEAWMGNR